MTPVSGHRPTALRRISVTIPISASDRYRTMRFESSFSRLSILRRIILNNRSSSSRCSPGGTAGRRTQRIFGEHLLIRGIDERSVRKREQRLGIAGIRDAVDLSRPDSHDIALRRLYSLKSMPTRQLPPVTSPNT